MAVTAILLIGIGAFMIHPPLAPLTVGLLLWVDLNRGMGVKVTR